MKIVFISPFPPSKVTLNEYGYHLIKSFTNKEEVKSIHVLTNHLENNLDYQNYKLEGVSIVPCWEFDSVKSLFQIKKQLQELKPDLVIMNIQFMSFGKSKISAGMGLLTPWLCKKMNIPTMVILHNIIETVNLESIGFSNNKLKSKIFTWIGEKLTRLVLKADVVGFTLSKYVDIITEKYKVKNAVLLPHGNFELPERLLKPSKDKQFNLMAFGKFGTYKKVEVLLDAVKILQKKYPSIEFSTTIAGTDNPNVKGYLGSVQKKYESMENLNFTGYVKEEDVPGIFHESDAVVFPYTTTTGSSGIIHQAGSYAKACVLPMIDDLKRVVEEEGYGGTYFEPDNAESLSKAIATLIDKPSLRKTFEDKNYEAAKGLPMNELSMWYLSLANNLKRA